MDNPTDVRDRIAELPYCVGSSLSMTGKGVHALAYAAWLPDWDGLRPPEQFVAASRTGGRKARQAAYEAAAADLPQWAHRIADLCRLYGLAWHHAIKQIREDVGLTATADRTAKDVTRLFFDAHDDQAKVNLFPESLPNLPKTRGCSRSVSHVDAARHALKHIHTPSDTKQWMRLVYNCKAAGLAESEVDSWSQRGDRYEQGELERGGFLCYQDLAPSESVEEALTALEAEAALQQNSFEYLNIRPPQSLHIPRGQSGCKRRR